MQESNIWRDQMCGIPKNLFPNETVTSDLIRYTAYKFHSVLFVSVCIMSLLHISVRDMQLCLL